MVTGDAPGATSVAVGDIDGDGIADIAASSAQGGLGSMSTESVPVYYCVNLRLTFTIDVEDYIIYRMYQENPTTRNYM